MGHDGDGKQLAQSTRGGCGALLLGAAKVSWDSVPIILVDVIKLLMPMTCTMRVGHAFGTSALAAASLGVLSFNIAGNMIVTAPLVAMDSVAPQAFGAGNIVGVGLAAQRALLLSFLFMLPTIPLWIHAEGLLTAMGQPDEVALLATSFMRHMLPGLFPYALFEAIRKFLYAQGESWEMRGPPLYAALVALAAHAAFLELFSPMGFLGAPVALSCTYLTMSLTLFLLVRFRRPAALAAWPATPEQQRRLWRDGPAAKRFLAVALASLVSLSEWLFWEVVCFRVGTFGTLQVTATVTVTVTVTPSP
jgi:MATE family multidrug resistance protein